MAEKGYPIESQTVEEFALIHITGDIVPVEFFQKIQFPKSGKPDLLAILILSDLLYWYRPIRPRNEHTGKLLPWRQKFFGQVLRRDYSYFVEKFGATARQCRDACARLKNLDLIEIQITPTSSGGSLLGFRPKSDRILALLALSDSRSNVSRKKADSRLNVSREKADSRLDVSRLTFERESSINTLDFLGETSQQQQEAAGGTAAAAAAAAGNPSEPHASRHTFGTVVAYVREKRVDAKNPKGLARTIWRNGSDDDEIQIWLNAQSAGEKRQAETAKQRQTEAEQQRQKAEFEIACAGFIESLSDDDYDSLFAQASDIFQRRVFTKAGTAIEFDARLFRSSIEAIMFQTSQAEIELAA